MTKSGKLRVGVEWVEWSWSTRWRFSTFGAPERGSWGWGRALGWIWLFEVCAWSCRLLMQREAGIVAGVSASLDPNKLGRVLQGNNWPLWRQPGCLRDRKGVAVGRPPQKLRNSAITIRRAEARRKRLSLNLQCPAISRLLRDVGLERNGLPQQQVFSASAVVCAEGLVGRR